MKKQLLAGRILLQLSNCKLMRKLSTQTIGIMQFFLSMIFFNTIYAQVAPAIEWQKCLGGSSIDYTYSIQQTTDGGFIVAGSSLSNDGDVSGNQGTWDYWIVKLDSGGNLIWQKCLGGSNYEWEHSIQQTADGGYVVAGNSNSNDGDVSGHHGGLERQDFWIVKLDTVGNLVWQKSMGGTDDDLAQSIQQTSDGGFIVTGWTLSNDYQVSGNHGAYDYWVVKLDSSGAHDWRKCFGGSFYDWGGNSIQETSDGGFIVAGTTASTDGDVLGNHGSVDCWIVKLDSNGNLTEQKCLGGTDDDYANSIQQTTDGGFIVAGSSDSNDGDVSGNHPDSQGYPSTDCWIVKLDWHANIEWQKSLGGSSYDLAQSIQQTTDGGYIIAGNTSSNDGDVSGNHGCNFPPCNDYWIVKLDTSGNIEWQKCLGGSGYYEVAYSVQQTFDGGYVVAGYSDSNDGDVSGNHGYEDYWIVKLSGDIATSTASPLSNFISLYPNPAADKVILSFSSNEEGELQIFNALGQIVFSKEINSLKKEIDVHEFQSGVYLISFATAVQKFERTFLKQ